MPSSIFRPDLLAGQVALVTGGGTGIGAAIARELGELGATVVIASRRAENIEPAAAGLSELLGRTVYGALVDIRDRDRVNALIAEVLDAHGRLDILVNNGGGQFMAPAETISPNGFDKVVANNLTGTWNMTRAAADAWMLQHGGRIINITMLTGRGFPGMAHSVSARAGVEAMTRGLGVEWAPRGIRVNCIAPGYIASSGLKRYPPSLGILEALPSRVPLKRLGRREEIAWMVAYLASPAGDYITGQTLTIAGGSDLWGDLWPVPDPPDLGPAVPEEDPWER
ncbi:MAG: SDR family oxidoreductase [Alphaproteobacteria bacterium]|nr:SDR family oxidoreductase [Alphaproteobacteria bacterium]